MRTWPTFEQGTAYDVLGVSPQAGPDELRKAFRSLSRQWHPDIVSAQGGDVEAAHERTATLNQAYGIVSDPAQRADYDAMLAAGEPEPELDVDEGWEDLVVEEPEADIVEDEDPFWDTEVVEPEIPAPPAYAGRSFDLGALKAVAVLGAVSVAALAIARQPGWVLALVAGLVVALIIKMAWAFHTRNVESVSIVKARPGQVYGRLGNDPVDGRTDLWCQELLEHLSAGIVLRAPAHTAFSHAVISGTRVLFVRGIFVRPGDYHWQGAVLIRPDRYEWERAAFVDWMDAQLNARTWLKRYAWRQAVVLFPTGPGLVTPLSSEGPELLAPEDVSDTLAWLQGAEPKLHHRMLHGAWKALSTVSPGP